MDFIDEQQMFMWELKVALFRQKRVKLDQTLKQLQVGPVDWSRPIAKQQVCPRPPPEHYI